MTRNGVARSDLLEACRAALPSLTGWQHHEPLYDAGWDARNTPTLLHLSREGRQGLRQHPRQETRAGQEISPTVAARGVLAPSYHHFPTPHLVV